MTEEKNIFEKFKITGQVAIVTGGAGLLGAEFCKTLAQAGAKVVVSDLDDSAAQSVADRLTDAGYTAIACQVDITNPESVQHMVDKTIQTFGGLDILVNSAALDPKFDPEHRQDAGQHNLSAFENYPLDAWNQALQVNLTGTFLVCQAATRVMITQEHGVIVNMSSIYGITAPDQRMYQKPGQLPQYKPAYYPVTKAGILGLTRYLAAYYAGKNIRVNAISPGGVFNNHENDFVKAYSARAILGRMAQKDEINGALLFLVSEASAYMTGANLVVDGGWTVW